MKSKKVKVSKQRDVRVHSAFWHTSKCLLNRGHEQKEGSFHQFLGSLVFTAFSMEAYLNWLGEKLFVHWRYLERLSPTEKLEVLADRLNVEIDWGSRPWQTHKLLFNFRNTIAHGKPETLIMETVEPLDEKLDSKLGKFERTTWEKFCTEGNAERAQEDIEAILRALHAAANPEDSLGPFFGGFQTHSAVYEDC